MNKFKSPPNPSSKKRGEIKKNFTRVIENFACGNCGLEVVGDGYTDHCPKCLWGKHVDEEIPGDRASDCRGLMEPVGAKLIMSNVKFLINYKCTKCRHVFTVREGKGDDREKLMKLLNV